MPLSGGGVEVDCDLLFRISRVDWGPPWSEVQVHHRSKLAEEAKHNLERSKITLIFVCPESTCAKMEARVGPVTSEPGGRSLLRLSRGPVRPISTWEVMVIEEEERPDNSQRWWW